MFAEGCDLTQLVPAEQQPVAASYVKFAVDAAEQYQLPLAWILGVIDVESNWHRHAISKAGAVGLMQLMPGTCAQLAKELNIQCEPLDPQTNIHLGTYYLARLLKIWNGDFRLASAAYNMGSGGLKKSLKANGGQLAGQALKYADAVQREAKKAAAACSSLPDPFVTPPGPTPGPLPPVGPSPKPPGPGLEPLGPVGPEPKPAPTSGGLGLLVAAAVLAWGLTR